MSKGVYRIYFLIICFLGTVLSILLGFMFSTVYDLMKTHYETFGAALTSVLKNPFSCYFNFYTPLFGIVIFLVFEVGIFIAYFVLNKNNGEDYEEELEEDYIEENIYEENAENKKKRSYNPDQDFFFIDA